MATITLDDGTGTLVFDGVQYRVRDWSDVFLVGPSRGRNLTVAGASGTLARGRVRDELAVELRDVFINGRANPDGSAATSPAGNVRALIRDLTVFLEDGPRTFTMTVVDGALTLEGSVTFEEMGRLRFIPPDLAEVNLLFTVADGRFVEVESGP